MNNEPRALHITIDGSDGEYRVQKGTPAENHLQDETNAYLIENAQGVKVIVWIFGCQLTRQEAKTLARPVADQSPTRL